MRALFPLGDVDLLDAYHLCGGRVVTFSASGAARSPTASGAPSSRRDGDGQYPYRGPGYRYTQRGHSVNGFSAGSSRDNDDAAVRDDGGAERAAGWEIGEREVEVIWGDTHSKQRFSL